MVSRFLQSTVVQVEHYHLAHAAKMKPKAFTLPSVERSFPSPGITEVLAVERFGVYIRHRVKAGLACSGSLGLPKGIIWSGVFCYQEV
jgi:hypothetical protein